MKFLQEYSFLGSVKYLTMHEIKIAEDLAVIVLEAARNENLSEVTKVNVSFGQMVQIVPEIFEFAFRETVRNTIAEDCELIIEILKVKIKCSGCGGEFNIDKNNFICIECGSAEIEIIQGKELFVKSIEGE